MVSPIDLDKLREATSTTASSPISSCSSPTQIVASAEIRRRSELDINIVRALLYLQRRDPRIDQRVRQYLQRPPADRRSRMQAVAALDPNNGEDRAFEIITALGSLMWTVDRAALVFCIDQVEDLRFFDDAEERFQRAVRDLIQIANRLTNAIIIISCLEDFYGQVRGVLAQSYIDRIEKVGPGRFCARAARRKKRASSSPSGLAHMAEGGHGGAASRCLPHYFGPQFFEEFGGLSTRRLLEHAQTRLRAKTGVDDGEMRHVRAGDPPRRRRLSSRRSSRLAARPRLRRRRR